MVFLLSLSSASATNVTSSVGVTKNIGSTSYGYVDKTYYGNQSSKKTVVIIVGVHPQENGIHNAVSKTLTNKSANLTKRYVLYKVTVTKDTGDYKKSRMNGQLLAQRFIVPDVSSENPMLVVDVHENHYKSSGYAYCRFLYLISNNAKTKTYANEIISTMPFLRTYTPPNHTSPQYVTEPIASKGISTMIYETYNSDSTAKKASDANAFINALDNQVGNSITASPAGGNYYAPQKVSLTSDSYSSIYYTLDGTNPTTSSTLYTEPISLNTSKTLKYIGVTESGELSSVTTSKYQIYVLTTYEYTARVLVKTVSYRGWKKVAYKAKVKVRYKVGKKWRYKYKYVTKYKWKKGWISYGIYKNQTKQGTRWTLT
ncbi:hypothetical protein DSECCO2_189860 [anaerobic digester metagenome]